MLAVESKKVAERLTKSVSRAGVTHLRERRRKKSPVKLCLAVLQGARMLATLTIWESTCTKSAFFFALKDRIDP